MIRKNIHKGLLFCFLLSSVISFGQTRKERKANREYDNFAYVDAIKFYEGMVDKGEINTSILSKLGDSYYFNGKFVEAFKWYDELFQGNYPDKNTIALDKEYYYRYGQTLKAVNQLEKADAVLREFAELKANDSRAQLLITNSELLEQTIGTSRFTLLNLSTNSEYSDYGATLLDNRLIFTSARENEEMKNKVHNWTNQRYTKLYTTIIREDGSFDNPVLFAKEIASKELNMGSAIFSKDGNTMYFTSNNGSAGGKKAQYNEDESSLLKIYKSRKQSDGRWGTMEALPFNLDGYNTAHPALTPDEKWMYFVSDRQGSLGQSDLFRVSMFATGRFGQVEHLGDKVNTAGRETFPFISSDYMLYFSSDGHPGFGGLDLYKVKINHDGQLGVPVNLGPDINSGFDDFGIYIDAATKKGFVSSNKTGSLGSDDVYLFVEKPCYQIVDGVVSDLESLGGIQGVEITVYDKQNKIVEKVYTDEQGYYSVEKLFCGQQYRVQINKEGYFTKEFEVNTNRDIQQRINIQIELINKGDDLFKKLKLSPIHFDFDSATIRPDAAIELMKVVNTMLEHPKLILDVRSHTDSRGDDGYNMKLSERRAQATIQWMIVQGVEASRLTGKGYGESQLVNHCRNGVDCTDEQHEENRRSEFIIVNLL
ncbi:PD40 domain-containing protein [Myroides sp. 1354]|uniref:OmpA family protein n=1 Tax=unclassified Myroides TaxID=2642485 RepID=UPI002578C75B|nr:MULTISPECIES: OmpA family protein [unclassified Myroides]MDM1045839.1 PD40 domain-containing protein [Myroides sp. R163-1]MDM1055706.1 PD40 domain-containing protein [Myroides sp. 1354]MDM1069798.1 PD40 domain-containing protein [Myroides sp. 1372]